MKERVELAQDWFGSQTWPPFHCFGHQYGCHDIMCFCFVLFTYSYKHKTLKTSSHCFHIHHRKHTDISIATIVLYILVYTTNFLSFHAGMFLKILTDELNRQGLNTKTFFSTQLPYLSEILFVCYR